MCRVTPFAPAQEVDGSDRQREAQERQARFNKMTIEEQLKLRAAEKTAAEDPAVVAAMKKRDQAIAEYRAQLRASLLKIDPTLGPILDKIRRSETQQ